MGVERRKRAVGELYDVTEVVLEQKITPVLRGRYCMQGPVDESDDSVANNMVFPGLEKEFGKCSLNQEVHMSGEEFGKCSLNQEVHMSGESGTCNVCSAPCSSCMHLKRAYMGPKREEFSDETFHVNASSQCSAIEADALSYVKTRSCDGSLHSNLPSVNSNRHYSSENADSRAALVSSGVLSYMEDVKMPSCQLVAEDDGFVKSAQQDFLSKKSNPKGKEGHGDNISCISESRHSTGGAGIEIVNLDRKDLSFPSASLDCSSPGVSAKEKFSCKLPLSEIPAYEDGDSGHSSLKSHTPLSHSQKGKSLSDGTNEMNVEQLPSLHIKKEQPESFIQYGNSSTEDLSSGLRSLGNQGSHDGCNSVVSMKMITKSEREGQLLDGKLKCGAHEEQDGKLSKLLESSDLRDPPFQVGNESDDSDIMEHDVKVCDICGDAGREDMLAICSRCTDGAEHTYCMRETLPSVPEGDWLCEECNLIEGMNNKKPDTKENRTDKDNLIPQVSGKIHAENVSPTSAMKSQTLEGGASVPKTSRCFRVGDSSFKNLDKGKLKPVHQSSSGNDSSDDMSGMTQSPHCVPHFATPKGSLSKSYSFSPSNLKPKVKVVDEYVPISKKEDGDYPHSEIKGGSAKMLRKSMSWIPSNSGRLNATEAKVKMLSSKFLHSLDPKGAKPVKECNYFEKKSLSKFDNSRVSSATTDSSVLTPKVDQKFTSPGDTGSSLSINRDIKPMQFEGTLNTFKRSTSSQVNRTANSSVSPASLPCSSGEQKKNIICSKEEPCSSSMNPGRQSSYNNGLLRSLESVNHVDKNLEISTSHLKSSIIDGVNSAASKSSLNDLCSTKSSKEDINNSNKLKAAIQAAVLKRPEIYRKKRVMDSCDEVSLNSSESQGGITSQDRLMGPHKFKNEISIERANVRKDIGRSTTDFDRKTSTPKQLAVNLKNGSSSIKSLKFESFMNTTENLTRSPSPLISFHLNVPGIPEHEYIWQGSFDIYRAGKRTGSHDGIQAHLSMTASPKVLDVVNKFPTNVILDEVPRLSMWPAQFHDSGAKEDNIALFFFAKDIESYERNYKNLLGIMMSNDLALRGNFGDFELLVFPSIHLPEKSQRWNTLFYLWGVFRGRKVNCVDSRETMNIPSLNSVPVEDNISTADATSSDDRSLAKHMDSASIASGFDNSNRDLHHLDSSFHQTNSDSHISSPISRTSSSMSGGEIVCTNNMDLGYSGRWSDKESRPSWLLAQQATLGGKVHALDNFEAKDTTAMMIIKHNNDENATIDSTSEGSVTADLEFNQRKRGQLHLSEPARSLSFPNLQMPMNDRNVVTKAEDCENKKPRTDNGCSTSYSWRNSTSLLTNDLGSHPLIKEARNNSFNMNNPPEDLVYGDSNHVDDFRLGANWVKWNTQPASVEDRPSLAPNLELALGAETKFPSKGVLPLFVELVGEKHGLTKPSSDKGMGQKEDESESLSLSLSFPFPEKAAKKENPLLLFRSSSKK